MAAKRVLVIAGLGNGSGTGASTARLFAKNGYHVALVARGADHVNTLADRIKADGGQATPFPVESYSAEDIASLWGRIHTSYPKNEYVIRAAVFNVAYGIWKKFLDTTSQEVQESLNTNIGAGFAFARGAILSFKENDIDATNGKRGALIFTGATASLRGNTTTSAFSSGKAGLRSLSQSLAKEFGPENIHVSHAIIDGLILNDKTRTSKPGTWPENPDVRLDPDNIAKSYLYLVNQDRSAWTWELDLRPAHEKW